MHNYHLDRGPSSCAFKVDIQKAYENVDWGFLHEILIGFGFHPRKRGIRQGDPLSPYLFTLIMEVFTLMLQRRVCVTQSFTYNRYCSKLYFINLCFADDLFLFAHGDADSARVIMDSLDDFQSVSDLVLSFPKNRAYFCNVLNRTKIAILRIIPFEEGRLPVKYLGVPLITTRLVYKDCKELIEKVQNQIRDWKNKSLSAAGRLQLLRSVIGDMRKGKTKVAWDVVCLPKKEGGLGIRKLDVLNKALMISHIWSLLNRKESLWVWNYMKVFAGLPRVSSSLNAIVDAIIARPKRRLVSVSLLD
nr:hypothetical protein [Tanacetum cinerariifolium]